MYTNGEKNTKSRSHFCSQKGEREKEGRKKGRETLRLYRKCGGKQGLEMNTERLMQPESGEILSR